MISKKEMPADREMLFYLAERLRYAAKVNRMVRRHNPDEAKIEFYVWLEAQNAYRGAKEIYLRKNEKWVDR